MLWLAGCGGGARVPAPSLIPLCEASQGYDARSLWGVDLPVAPGAPWSSDMAPDPFVVVRTDGVWARSRLGNQLLAGDEEVELLVPWLTDLTAPTTEPVQVAIARSAPAERVRRVIEALAQAGYERISLVTRGQRIDIDAPPDRALAAQTRADYHQHGLADGVAERIDTCAGMLDFTVGGAWSVPYPLRCERLAGSTTSPLSACPEAARRTSVSALHGVVASDEPRALAVHVRPVAHVLAALGADGTTFDHVAAAALAEPGD